MARFPKIDSPCPLNVDEQLRIDGYCGRCDKHVHALDGMSDAERAALLQAAKGSLCVSYRAPQRRSAGFGVAIAATLVATSAFAGEPPCAATAAPIAGPSASMPATPVAPASLVADTEQLDFIMVGGVSEPGEAEWVGDDARPQLPEAEQATALEYIVITGGVNDPADAAWVDDSTLPELPVLALQDGADVNAPD